MSEMNFEKKFGKSAIFVTSTLMVEGGVPPSSSPAALLKEAIHVISCGYEDKTEWGLEVNTKHPPPLPFKKRKKRNSLQKRHLK